MEPGLQQSSVNATHAQDAQARAHGTLPLSLPFTHYKSYNQDLYASIWFRLIPVYLTLWVIAVIIAVILSNQGQGQEWQILGLYAIPAPLVLFLMYILGGIAFSRVFK